DGHAVAQLELRDRLAGLRHLRLLAGDEREVLDGPLDHLGVARGLTDTGVDDDLHETRHLHRVLVPELLDEGLRDLLAVLLLEARLVGASLRGSRVRHYSFSPDFFA